MANDRSLAWYHANKNRIDRDVKRAYSREYYKKNRHMWKRTPEQQAKINARKRDKYAQDKAYREQQKTKTKEWQQNNPDKRKAQRIKKFGLTLEQFNKMLESQNGKCAICGYSDLSDPNLFPVVDHCHDSGLVRGLLCSNCNLAIGQFKDDPELLRAAADYVEWWSWING
jgi:hypothetical protein